MGGYIRCHFVEVAGGGNDLPATTLQGLGDKGGNLHRRRVMSKLGAPRGEGRAMTKEDDEEEVRVATGSATGGSSLKKSLKKGKILC